MNKQTTKKKKTERHISHILLCVFLLGKAWEVTSLFMFT